MDLRITSRACRLAVAALGLAALASTQSLAGDGLTAEAILNKVDDLYRGDSAHGVMSMHIVTEHWERSLKVAFWTQGKDKSLFRILEPKKEKDTATLRVGTDIWNYLPKVNRVVKLPSSMMSASWMGSHITNDDLVKESRFAEDYTFEVTGRMERRGTGAVEITCMPRPNAPVVWGKVLVYVDEERYLPIELLYFDEDMAKVRTMSFTEVETIDDRTLPTRITVTPEDKPNEKTTLVYEDITYNADIDPQTFSLRELRR